MMYSALLSVAALVAAVAAQDGPVIATPSSLTVCQPVQLTFSGGTPPYIITAIPAADATAQPLTTIADSATSSPLSWKVNLAAGTNITLQIVDSTGAKNFDSPVVIFPGSDTSCVGTTPSSSAAASGSATSDAGSSTSAVASSASAASTSAAASVSSAISSAVSSASSAAASASASKTSAASSASGSSSATKASSASSSSGSPTSSPSSAGLSKSANWAVAALGLVGAAVLA